MPNTYDLMTITLAVVIAIFGVQMYRIYKGQQVGSISAISDHTSEVVLLGLLGIGTLLLLYKLIDAKGMDKVDVAAFLLIVQRVIEAVTNRWTQRSVDRMAANQANSGPANPAALSPDTAPPQTAPPAPPTPPSTAATEDKDQ